MNSKLALAALAGIIAAAPMVASANDHSTAPAPAAAEKAADANHCNVAKEGEANHCAAKDGKEANSCKAAEEKAKEAPAAH